MTPVVMSHMIPVSCVPGLLAQGLVVYPDESGGMSYAVCETLLGRARVDGLGWQEAADLWVDIDNPDTRERVLRAIYAARVDAYNARHGTSYNPQPVACPVFHYVQLKAEDLAELLPGELVEARLESDEMTAWMKLEPLPVGSSPIDALAAVCRGPR